MSQNESGVTMSPSKLQRVCYGQDFIFGWCLLFIIIASACPLKCLCQERTLTFPTGWEHATAKVYDIPKLSDNLTGFFDFDWTGEAISVAAGEVRITDDAYVGIEVNATEGYEEFFAGLPATGIQRIELSNATLSDSLFKSLERIETLRELILIDCRVTNADANLLNGLPQLQRLHCRQREDSLALHPTIALWAAKCPQLQYYYDGESLSAEEILRFGHHQATLFITVSFDANAFEVIDALSQVPNLIALNVNVTKNAPENYHVALPKLKRLALANWSGGQLDKDFLDSIGKLVRLRTLRIQGEPEIADGFIENLADLRNMEAISFNVPLSEHQEQILPNILLGMDKIRELPELSSLSTEQLQKLSQRSDLRSLRISKLGASVSEQQLANAIRANSRLELLELSQVKFTPEIAEAICQCERLNHLGLSVPDFDGQLLTSLKQLRSLDSLNLSVENRPLNLSALAQIPNLASIQISLNTFDPGDWSFIAETKTLQRIEIINGFCDDSVVAWIRQNNNLRGFSTVQSCILTDLGVTELRKCSHLESLSIDGFISAASIESLGQLPNLKSLSVGTSLLDDTSKKRLRERFSSLEHFDLGEFRPATGKIAIGDDSFYRQVPDEGRSSLDALEGMTLEKMLGSAMNENLKKKLDGKVVFVEFWGTWCGPVPEFCA